MLDLEPLRAAVFAEERERAGAVADEHVPRAGSATASSAMRKSSSSWNSCPTRLSASRWFGDTSHGSASTPSRNGSPSVSSTVRTRRRLSSRIAVA